MDNNNTKNENKLNNRNASYTKIAEIDINTTSGIVLKVTGDAIAKTESKESKETSRNIIIHEVEEIIDMDTKELE